MFLLLFKAVRKIARLHGPKSLDFVETMRCAYTTSEFSGNMQSTAFDEEMSELCRIYSNQRIARLSKQHLRANVDAEAQLRDDISQPCKMPAPQRFVRKHKAIAIIKNDVDVARAYTHLSDPLSRPSFQHGSEAAPRIDDLYDVLLNAVMHDDAEDRVKQDVCVIGDLNEVRPD
jgi:hypothetical protein